MSPRLGTLAMVLRTLPSLPYLHLQLSGPLADFQLCCPKAERSNVSSTP